MVFSQRWFDDYPLFCWKAWPWHKHKTQVQRRSLRPKSFTIFFSFNVTLLNFLLIVFLFKELDPGIICIAFRTIILMKLNFNSFWWKLVPVLELYFAQVEFKCSLVRTGSCKWILIVLRTIILINSVHSKFNYSLVKTSSKFVWLTLWRCLTIFCSDDFSEILFKIFWNK